MRKYLGNKAMVFALVAPAMLLFTVMVLYPLGILVVRSFTEWDGLNASLFNGVDNYIRLFKDPIFYKMCIRDSRKGLQGGFRAYGCVKAGRGKREMALEHQPV